MPRAVEVLIEPQQSLAQELVRAHLRVRVRVGVRVRVRASAQEFVRAHLVPVKEYDVQQRASLAEGHL